MRKAIILIFCLLISTTIFAQNNTEIGITGGGIHFYPIDDKSYGGTFKNNFGWSAGIFVENTRKAKIHPVFELNFYNLSSDILLKQPRSNGWSYGVCGTVLNMCDHEKSANNTSFKYLALSGGVKYFLNNKLFAYPGLEVTRDLNNSAYLDSKTKLNLKFGGGLSFKKVDVMLEYTYGLDKQVKFYETPVELPYAFYSKHRNTYLQLKVQVPVYRFK